MIIADLALKCNDLAVDLAFYVTTSYKEANNLKYANKTLLNKI